MKYIPALDGLRACAVTLVLFAHTRVLPFQSGDFGVEMFFVLSGFLITTLLLQELRDTGRINIPHFYARRLLRLYPALLLFLLFYALGAHAVRAPFVKDVLIAGLYLTDYAIAFGFHTQNSLVNHTWSLAVEEQFYLLWPLVLLALCHFLRGKRRAALLFAGFVVATAWKVVPLMLGAPVEWVYFRFDTRLGGLLLGAALAVCRREGIRIPLASEGVLAAGLLMLFCIFSTATYPAGIYQTVLPEIFAFFLIAKIMESPDGTGSRWLSAPVPVFFGRISYAVYLFHYPIALYMREKMEWWLAFPVTLALSAAIAWFSWRTVERVGRLRARQFRHAGPQPQEGAP